jgi:predicted LPLAT superfamily acyltransferase
MVLIARWPRLREMWLQCYASRAGETPTDASPTGATGVHADEPLFSRDDALTSLLLLDLAAVALVKKPGAWPSEAGKFSRNMHTYFPGHMSEFKSEIPKSIVTLTGKTAEELSVSLYASYVLEKLEVVGAAMGRYRPPSLRLVGASRLQEALDQGSGAVLWCEQAFSASLLLKAALASSGFQVHHLSRPFHNLSSTRFGLRFLNPIVRKAEDPYLAERIMIQQGDEMGASRRVMARLKEGKIVSITISSAGAQTVDSPMLDGVLRVATGAPHFALRSGAPLLPVFSYRDGQEYLVEVGEPIRLAGRSREEAFQFAVDELARRLEAHVHNHPLDWVDWYGGVYSEPAPDA